MELGHKHMATHCLPRGVWVCATPASTPHDIWWGQPGPSCGVWSCAASRSKQLGGISPIPPTTICSAVGIHAMLMLAHQAIGHAPHTLRCCCGVTPRPATVAPQLAQNIGLIMQEYATFQDTPGAVILINTLTLRVWETIGILPSGFGFFLWQLHRD